MPLVSVSSLSEWMDGRQPRYVLPGTVNDTDGMVYRGEQLPPLSSSYLKESMEPFT